MVLKQFVTYCCSSEWRYACLCCSTRKGQWHVHFCPLRNSLAKKDQSVRRNNPVQQLKSGTILMVIKHLHLHQMFLRNSAIWLIRIQEIMMTSSSSGSKTSLVCNQKRKQQTQRNMTSQPRDDQAVFQGPHKRLTYDDGGQPVVRVQGIWQPQHFQVPQQWVPQPIGQPQLPYPLWLYCYYNRY